MPTSDMDVIESLRPVRPAKIMDLVAEAGVDVRPWAVREDGAPVKNPAANPNYCYEWSFGGDEGPIVLCIWHVSIKIQNGRIEEEDNLRLAAIELERSAEDHFKEQKVKQRAKRQARRARAFDAMVQKAFRRPRTVRVVMLDGERLRDGDDPGVQSSIVDFRLLDPEPWYVQEYHDTTGNYRLVRGVPQPLVTETLPLIFIDQFSIPPSADRYESRGLVYPRSADVRRGVLQRASGKCECCSAPGFKMANSGVYLETHHVFPLAGNGPDVEWNVVAICPNDHRRAHFASDRYELRARLVDQLISHYPAAGTALRTLLNRAQS